MRGRGEWNVWCGLTADCADGRWMRCDGMGSGSPKTKGRELPSDLSAFRIEKALQNEKRLFPYTVQMQPSSQSSPLLYSPLLCTRKHPKIFFSHAEPGPKLSRDHIPPPSLPSRVHSGNLLFKWFASLRRCLFACQSREG